MSIFGIAKEVFDLLPEACFGVVVAKGIDNKSENDQIGQLLMDEVKAVCARMEGINVKQYEPVVYYREAFQKIGINPNRYANSVEALTKRVTNGTPFPRINNIVDIGNAMSIKYVLPMGAHDIDKLSGGDLMVRLATSEDTFIPFGETEAESVPEGEMVYATGSQIKTRRWIWRQSEVGKIDENSCNVVFPIDGFLGKNDDKVKAAAEELAKHLEELFGCQVKTDFLTSEKTVCEL